MTFDASRFKPQEAQRSDIEAVQQGVQDTSEATKMSAFAGAISTVGKAALMGAQWHKEEEDKAKKQSAEALEVLKNMEVDSIDEEQQALIAFETFRASGDASQQQKAISQFNKLYQQTPKFIYKFHLEILKSDNEVAPST